MCGDTQIPSSKLQTTIDYLAQSNPRTQLTGYESQFNVSHGLYIQFLLYSTGVVL